MYRSLYLKLIKNKIILVKVRAVHCVYIKIDYIINLSFDSILYETKPPLLFSIIFYCRKDNSRENKKRNDNFMLKIVVSFCLISIKKIFWAVSCRSLNSRRARLRNRAVTWNSFTIGTINLYDLLYRTKNLITDSFGIMPLIVLTFEFVPFVTDRRGIKIPRQILNSSHNFDVFRKIFKGGWLNTI